MTRKTVKKLLSLVLVLAVCVSGVVSCLITANAEDTGATYTVNAETVQPYANEGKATVTFNLASGFTEGNFTLLKDNSAHTLGWTIQEVKDEDGNVIETKKLVPSPWNYEYRDVEIKVVGGTTLNGEVFSADDISIFNDTNNNGVNDAEELGEKTDSEGNPVIVDDIEAGANNVWFTQDELEAAQNAEADKRYKEYDENGDFVKFVFQNDNKELLPFDPDNTGRMYRHDANRLSNISFSSSNGTAYKSLTFELTFEWDYHIKPGEENKIIFANASQYDIWGKAYTNPVLKNGDTEYVLSEQDSDINYFHNHAYKSISKVDSCTSDNDYGVYMGTCKFCGETIEQVVVDEAFNTNYNITTPNSYYGISALNVVYEKDGTVSLNVHCAGYNGAREKLVMCYTDGTKTSYSADKSGEFKSTETQPSHFAKTYVDDTNTTQTDAPLPLGTVMYVIEGLSAKDIQTKFYLTRVVEGAGDYEGSSFVGNTVEVCLKDYCTDVLSGDKVYYPAGTTNEQKLADQAVATAFINYGVAAANALNHKVSYDTEKITVTDTWNGNFTEPTETDEAGNIIINTAAEFAWVALKGGNATSGKNYKVAANQVFDMSGSEGITLDSTAAQVKAATATTNLWNYSKGVDFLGTFDGNDIIVYNIRNAAGVEYGGLFPRINGVNSSIKNVTVKASVFYGYHGAGAIIGQAGGQFTTKIENVAVENCYMTDNNNTNPDAQRSAGVFVGSSANHCIQINNCFAAGNGCSGVHSTGGFIGRSSAWAPSDFTITNSISLGVSPYTTAGVGDIGGDIKDAKWTNVYTDTDLPSGASTNAVNGIKKLSAEQMKGNAAAENMSALDWSGVWKTTDSYPTFNPDVYCTDVWDGTVATGFAGGTGVENDPYIIATAEQLAYLVKGAGSTTSNSTTRYKYYKVSDGIKFFNMNGFNDITVNSSCDELDVSNANTSCNWSNNYVNDQNQVFQGFFDGNGVTVYNIYASGKKAAGLFPSANGDINANGDYGDTSVAVKYPLKIENVTVKSSYFSATTNAGGILGEHQNFYRSGVIINNCSVENCSFAATYTGAIIGTVAWEGNTTIDNCFVADNKYAVSGTATTGSVVGTNANGNQAIALNNSIIIGAAPYTSGNTGLSTNSKFTNVYTTESANSLSGITTLTAEQMQGAAAVENMPVLGWGYEWFEGEDGEYPLINGEVYADVWDGTKVEPKDIDGDGIYDVTSAEELAWVALIGDTATEGKSYKVVDGIKYFNMNGMTGISLNSTASEVTSATKSTTNIWRFAAEGKVGAFCGNFDGNGVTVYNLCSYGYGYGGLFPYVLGDTTIENVTVKASFISGFHSSGGIVGSTELTKTLNVNKCIVENCYIGDNGNTNPAANRVAAGIVAQAGNSNINISNCLVVGNNISAAGYEAAFLGKTGDYAPTGITFKDSIALGVTPYSNDKLGGGLGKGLTEKLTITNVYTDQDITKTGVTTIDATKVTGEDAVDEMPNLDWNTVWFTGAYGEYPCFVDDGIAYVPGAIEALLQTKGYYSDYIANFYSTYSADEFESSQPGDCDFYATGLTLKTNPYMTVTFAFRNNDTAKYLDDKANIIARFEVNGQTVDVKGNEMINNNSDPDRRAGRYHMVRLEGINVANLCDDITVTLLYNGTQVGTGKISVAGFAHTAANAGDDYEYYETAAQALVFYAEALQKKALVYGGNYDTIV